MQRRTVRLPREVQETIRALHPEQQRRVRAGIDRLLLDPDAGKELQSELAGWRSLRIGRLRIIYRATRTMIDIAAIGPRESIYLEAARLNRARRKGG